MKIAITGASGFIGRHLVQRLTQEGFYDLRLLAYDDASFLKVIKGDLLKEETLSRFLEETDLVVHLAGTFSPPWANLIALNITATANLLEACCQSKVKRVIFTSSGAVYGEPPEGRASKETDSLKPNTFYGLTKKFVEDLLTYYDHNFNIKSVVLRLPNVYGPGNNKGVIYNFLNSIKKENNVTIYGTGNQARNFLFVSDVVDSILQVIKKYHFVKSATFNISSSKVLSLNELVKLMEQLFRTKAAVIYKPQRNNFLQMLWENIDKAERVLGWQPKVSLKEGLKITMNSLKYEQKKSSSG